MAHIEGEIVVKRPAEEVFDFVADERHEPRFNPHMLTAEKVSDGLIGKGTRFRAEIDNLGRTVPMDIEFTAVERPRRLASSTHMTAMDVRGELTFDPVPEGTRLRWSWDVEEHGILKLMGPAASFIGRRQERAIWSSLKWLLEESTHRDEAEEGRVRMQSGPVTAFLRYLRRTNPGGAIEYVGQLLGGLIHPQLLRSGATPQDDRRLLPGDELVPSPVWEATRAVTIDAPAVEVWPWVAQMGFGRGGWYGWNPLDREDTGVFRLLAVAPPKVDDTWLDGPGCTETKGAWTVKAVDPPRTLALYSMRDPISGRELDPAQKPRLFIDTGWVFHLDEISSGRTHLLARTRVRMNPSWSILALKWMGGGDTVMQRRLLDGIKIRVETAGLEEPNPHIDRTGG
jgi:carbon monoxide dehydrogenase subunit G